MKRIISFLLGVLLLTGLGACGTTQAPSDTALGNETTQPSSTPSTEDGTKIETDSQPTNTDNAVNSSAQAETNGNTLIAYFAYNENIGDTSGMTVDAIASASLGQSTGNEYGNLQIIAQVIQERTGGNVHSILVTEPYDPVYDVMRVRAYDEMDNGILPELQTQVDNLEQYDVVYLGLPVWAGQMPAPVTSFLTENNLAGKTIVPFNIHLGSGFGRIKSQIEELCPGATIMDAFTIRASTGNDDVRSQASAWLDGLGVN